MLNRTIFEDVKFKCNSLYDFSGNNDKLKDATIANRKIKQSLKGVCERNAMFLKSNILIILYMMQNQNLIDFLIQKFDEVSHYLHSIMILRKKEMVFQLTIYD